MNTNGPTDVTACLQRRVTSSPDNVPGAGVIHAPPDVSNMTVLVLSSTCGAGNRRDAADVHSQGVDGGPTARHTCNPLRVGREHVKHKLHTNLLNYPFCDSRTMLGPAAQAPTEPTMRPPPTAPPDMCSRVPTNTEPCW
jgi:hypothetical protein